METRKQFLAQVQAIFGPLKWRMLIVFVGITAVQGLSLITPYIQGMIIDSIIKQRPIEEIYQLVAIAGAVLLGSHWLLQFPREKFEINKVDYDIDERASDHTMAQMMRLSVGQHNMIHSGLKHSVISRGQDSLKTLIFLLLFEIVPTVSRIIIMLIAMCWLSLTLGAFAVGAAITFISLTTWMNYRFSTNLKRLERMWNLESKFRNEIIQHVTHILLNAQEKKARKEADAKYGETVKIAKPIWHRFLFFAYLRVTLVIMARISVMLIGAREVYAGNISTGSIVVLWAWSNNAFDSMNQIGSLQREIIRKWASIRRYCEFLGIKNDVIVAENPVILKNMEGRIEIKDVSFAYNSRMPITQDEEDFQSKPEKSSQPALRHVSLTIEPGETVAIVGESGSDKTTLANLLLRASDPTEGQILIDGHDLRLLHPQSFREMVGTVEQHVPLFDRTLKENILYGLNGRASDVTPEEITRIARMAQISRFEHKLEQGFDTIVGERGIKLSGGERQRVGIARALIKDPGILIFDEATSSLDAAVEADIREAIREASQGRTTIIIAHRFSTIRYANRIVVMDNGEVVGEGKHEDLYISCPAYKRLVDHQINQIGQ